LLMMLVLLKIIFTFAPQSNHNKDYSVVKTFKAGSKASLLLDILFKNRFSNKIQIYTKN